MRIEWDLSVSPLVDFRKEIKKKEPRNLDKSFDKPASTLVGSWDEKRLAIIRKYEAANISDEEEEEDDDNDDGNGDGNEQRVQNKGDETMIDAGASDQSDGIDEEYYDSEDSMIDDTELSKKRLALFRGRNNAKKTKYGGYYVSTTEHIELLRDDDQHEEDEEDADDEIMDDAGDDADVVIVERHQQQQQSLSQPDDSAFKVPKRSPLILTLSQPSTPSTSRKPVELSPRSFSLQERQMLDCIDAMRNIMSRGATSVRNFPSEMIDPFFQGCLAALATGKELEKFFKIDLSFLPFSPKTLRLRYQRCLNQQQLTESKSALADRVKTLEAMIARGDDIETCKNGFKQVAEAAIYVAKAEDEQERLAQKKRSIVLTEHYKKRIEKEGEKLKFLKTDSDWIETVNSWIADAVICAIASVPEARKQQDAERVDALTNDGPNKAKASNPPTPKPANPPPKNFATPSSLPQHGPPKSTVFDPFPVREFADRCYPG